MGRKVSRRDKEYGDLECEILRVTDRAVLVSVEGEGVWIPLSLLEDDNDLEPGEMVLSVESWKIKEMGL